MAKLSTIRLIRLTVVVLALGYFVATKYNLFQRDQEEHAPSPTQVQPSTTEHITVGELRLTRCALGPVEHPLYASVEAYCAEVTVPENWAEPDAAHITLHLAVIPARTAEPQPDPLVILDGGPGGAATEDFPGLAPAFGRILNSRAIVLMDQRGTGRSHPLHCDFTQNSERELDESIDRCVTELQKTSQLQYYTTSQSIQDLEWVRARLGFAHWNVYGVSYGTRVAQQYAQRFPQRVRSIILDSPVPNTLALGQEHSRNLDEALAHHFDRCEAQADCKQRYHDLHATALALKAQLAQKPKTVAIADPWSNAPTSLTINADSFAQTIRLLSYSEASAQLIPYLLTEAKADRWQPLASAELLVGRSLKPITQNNVLELSILCSEDADRIVADPAQQRTVLGTTMMDHLTRLCRRWPTAPKPADFNRPLDASIPTLILAGDDDPVTPVRYANDIAAKLPQSTVLVFAGSGHAQVGSACAPMILEKFLKTTDFKQLPTSCLKSLGPAAPMWSVNGPKA